MLSQEGYQKYSRQVKDDSGGFDNFTCALFGTPGEQFEFVLTGRHLTLRADGNNNDNMAFGGPIFYGHAVRFTEKADHPNNVWWHQALLANKLYQSFSQEQKKASLFEKSPRDSSQVVILKGQKGNFSGIPRKNMSTVQKRLFDATLASLLDSFQPNDVAEAKKIIDACGGVDRLHISFYSRGDTGEDGVWERWLIEGPGFVWYFRGSPHVHAWVNIGMPK